jgi:AcrR family transcriptional regulator
MRWLTDIPSWIRFPVLTLEFFFVSFFVATLDLQISSNDWRPMKKHRNRSRAAAAPVAMDARMLRSREALRNGLLELLQRKSLEQITIRDIVARADIGYATFFRHHPTKESLLRDLAADQIDGLVNMALQALDAVDSRAACMALCAYVAERRALWSTLLTGGAAGAMREEFIRIASRVAAERMETGARIPAELGAVHASSAIIEILAWWLRQSRPMSVRRLAEIMDRLVIGPLVTS